MALCGLFFCALASLLAAITIPNEYIFQSCVLLGCGFTIRLSDWSKSILDPLYKVNQRRPTSLFMKTVVKIIYNLI